MLPAAVIGLAYPLSNYIAVVQYHPHGWAIIRMNLLLGWTAIGWLPALRWSLTMPEAQGGTERHGNGSAGHRGYRRTCITA